MLTISIPDEIDKQLSSITSNKEEFIISAIRQKIATGKHGTSSKILSEEYKQTAEENKLISEDFEHADKENWDDY